MVATRNWQETRRTVGGVALEVFTSGQGTPLLVLHDYEYVNGPRPFLDRLAERYQVSVPSHPGCGGSDLPREFDSIDDLAYVYLDFLRERAPERAHLVGLGFGGWVAAEVAIRSTEHLRSLTLVDAVGIKVGDRTTRDIADIYVIGAKEFLALSWHDPAVGEQAHQLAGLHPMDEARLTTVLRNRQTIASLGWKPFMHHPRLRARLARINIPTLVLWGEADRIVTPAYGQAYAESIPGARFQTIPAAGHYPYLEQPDAFLAALTSFLPT